MITSISLRSGIWWLAGELPLGLGAGAEAGATAA